MFDYPKKPKSSYQLFLTERVIQLKEKKPNEEVRKLFGVCAEEWGQLSEGEKKKYEKAAKKDKERYKEELEEFNEKGYYTPNKKGSEKKETQSQKKNVKSLNLQRNNNLIIICIFSYYLNIFY